MQINEPKKKRNILLLAPQGVAGGIATWTRYLLKYTDSDIINYHVINTAKLYDTLGKKLGLRGVLCGLRDGIKRAFSLIFKLYTIKPDAVYFTCAPSTGFIYRDIPYMLLLRLLGQPYFVHFRGGRLNYFFGRNAFERYMVRHALGGALLLIAISRPVETEAKKLFGTKKVCYFPNMIDDELVNSFAEKIIRPAEISTEPWRLLQVAWQAPEKGSVDIIDALSLIKSNFICHLVGDVADENRRLLEERIHLKGLEGKISVTGRKSGNELREYYRQADLFVFPSHSEGFPNAILEAMASGLPILSTDVGNIREMIDADGAMPAGMLLDRVNPIDVEELAKKMDFLLQNSQIRANLSKNGRQKIKNSYTASKVVPKLEDMILKFFQET